jgi:DNA (cytosine-5)-methyltransferase 1
MTANLTVTDLFAGAGGSSTGAELVPGVRVRMAANHWRLAMDVHNANLPHADHDCADISQVDPRRYPRTDVLWASPECTHHSQARGQRRYDAQPDLFGETLPSEASQRSRATMWDVPRFAEHHRYAAVIVENVVDAYHWPAFPSWLTAMDAFGYDHQTVWLNSMHAQGAGIPAPQSRDRMYVVFWRRGNKRPDLSRWTRPLAWCAGCDEMVRAIQVFKRPDRPAWGRYRQQYVYRCPNRACRNQIVEPAWLPAAAAIDWTIAAQRIGDRDKPLADKTLRRIAAGLARYARPIHLEAAGHTYDAADPRHPRHADPTGYYRAWPIDVPIKTIHTAESKGIADDPLLIPVEGRDGKTASPASVPMRTQTARNETALLVPAGGTWNHDARPVMEPMRTRTTRESDAVVVPPFIAELRGGGSKHRLVAHPLATVTAAGNHHALIMRNNSSRGDGAEMVTPVDEPLRTLTTTGHQSLLEPVHEVPGDTPGLTGTVDPARLPRVEDCLFRMLEPQEIAAAMAFPDRYRLMGNKRERVRLCGNAVTPPAARDLIAAVAESLDGPIDLASWPRSRLGGRTLPQHQGSRDDPVVGL